jgi:hypothetical protein
MLLRRRFVIGKGRHVAVIGKGRHVVVVGKGRHVVLRGRHHFVSFCCCSTLFLSPVALAYGELKGRRLHQSKLFCCTSVRWIDSFGPKHCGLKFERGTFAMPRVLGIKNKMDAPFFGWVLKISACCSDGIVQKILLYCFIVVSLQSQIC